MGYIINPYRYATGTPFENEYSLDFDGVDDNVIVPYNSTLDVVTAAHSLSFWFKTTDGSIQGLMEKGRNDELAVFLINKKIYWGGTNGYYGGTTFVNDGNWHHVVCVATGTVTGSSIYIDGSVVNTGNAKVQASANTDDFTIGMTADGNNEYQGNLDEIAIFDYALSASDVTSMYNSGTPNNLDDLSTSPVAWWRMGENGSWKSPQWLLPENSNKDKYSNFSFSCDGVDDYIDVGVSSGTNDVSISCWMKSTEVVVYNDSRMPFGGRPSSGGSNYSIGRIRSQFATPTELNVALFNTFGSTVLNDGNWHNLIYTYNHTTKEVKAYVDGNTTPEATVTFPAWISNYQFRIGDDPNSSWFFNGNVDECAVWYSVLGTSDITTIYNSGTPGDISSLSPIGYWRSENSTFSTNWTVTDNGSGSNDGTSANMTIEDRVGDAPNSTSNASSYNMDEVDRESNTPPTP